MSTLRVNKLENTNTSNGGISIDTSGHVSIDGQQLPSSGPLSNRNLIINGAMQVAQRGTQETGVTTGGYFTSDRFESGILSAGTWDISQSTDSPSEFSNSFKYDCTAANSSLSAGSLLYFTQKIEAQNLQHLAYGTADAQDVTFSFYFKTNKNGVYTVELFQGDSSRSIGFEMNVTQSGWQRYEFVIPGDTAGTINNDNGIGFWCFIWLAAGTTFTSGTFTDGAWDTGTAADRVSSNQVNFADSTSNECFITGVQLEVGEVATPFEHRSYGEELAKCQRYFERINYTYDPWTFITVATVPGTSSAINMVGSIYYETKRTDPTVTSTAANTFRQNGGNVSDNVATSIGFAMETPKSCRIEVAATGIFRTSGLSGWISRQSTSTCYIDFDAEV